MISQESWQLAKNLLFMSLIVFLTCSFLGLNMIGITVAQLDHDVAVIGVTPFSTSVRLGESVNITVVVENQGTNNETFDVTVYYDNTTIGGAQTVTDLPPGNQTTLTFSWDTNTTDIRDEIYATDRKEKAYDINARAPLALDENSTDNTLVREDAVRVRSQYIAVIPQSTLDEALTPGKNYTVSICTDYNGSDVWGWQFTLKYNPSVLNGTAVTNGDLIATEKDLSATFQPGTFDNEEGFLSLTFAFFYFLEEPAPLTSGPGILANVTFTVVGEGDSEITLGVFETKLKGYSEGGDGDSYEIVSDYEPNIGHLLHGFFQNTEEVIHDVAVFSVAPSSTSVKLGELVNVTVVVENQGTVNETFDVRIDRSLDGDNWWLINETKTVQDLGAGTNTSLTFAWNTANVSKGTYIIRAVASTVYGEADTEDNTLESHDRVTVTATEAPPLPIELIIAIVVVVVVIGAVWAYVVKRRRKPTPE